MAASEQKNGFVEVVALPNKRTLYHGQKNKAIGRLPFSVAHHHGAA